MTGCTPEPYTAENSVSRETHARLEQFAALVRKWSPVINLVSKSDLADLETRHIADSLQLSRHIPQDGGLWADIGSGGGFPGLVIAIIADERSPDLEMHLIESDQRKAAFLRTAARELALRVTVHCERVEALDPLHADVISARALAPLDTLLGYAQRHLSENGTCAFLKGQAHHSEIETARANWHFHCESHPSQTDPNARILLVSQLQHV